MTTHTTHSGRTWLGTLSGVSALALLMVASLPGTAAAQGVERHKPETPATADATIEMYNDVPDDQDATPIGPGLQAIVLLNADDAVQTDGVGGVQVGQDLRVHGDTALDDTLKVFIGKPISRRLIAEMSRAVAARYRELGYPFVSVGLPEQEISQGTIRLRVVEFRVGQSEVKGAKAADEAAISQRLALKSGDAINVDALGRNLQWLNKYPFRNVRSVFKPGGALGQTDQVLSVTYARPWSVYAGYANSGSPSTGMDRYYVGGSVGGLLGRDSLLSAQITGSGDVLKSAHPDYRGESLSYVLPTVTNQQVEINVDYVQSNQAIWPFGFRLNDIQSSIGYRTALPKAAGLSDLRFGIEGGRETSDTFFGGTSVYSASFETYQMFAGFHTTRKSAKSDLDVDVAFHMSPGNITDANSNARAVLYSQGHMENARYSYVTVQLIHDLSLPKSFRLETEVFGQLATTALPRSVQAGLGNHWLVRGYSYDDGAYDTSVVLRNTLYTRSVAMGAAGQAEPYLFVDLGQGRDIAADYVQSAASLGLGTNIALLQHVNLNLEGAWRLKDTYASKKGAGVLSASLNVRF